MLVGDVATYVIGDVQGCFDSLRALARQIDFDPEVDTLWLAGDLVNRGPKSAEVLRWCLSHEDAVHAVLGNHDLHLLAAAEGLRRPKGRDTLQDVLRAPDREALLEYLAGQPFMLEAPGFVLTHAGWPPRWSLDELRRRAKALQAGLAGPDRRRLLGCISGVEAHPEHARAAEDAAALTRMRTVDDAGEPVYGFAGPPSACPPGERPWFDDPRWDPEGRTAIFGHWAALGLRVRPRLIALDSGCVWGHRLSAVRLEDRRVFQVEAME